MKSLLFCRRNAKQGGATLLGKTIGKCIAFGTLALSAFMQHTATHAATLYANDFETAVDPAWSTVSGRAPGINRTPNGRGFLGWAGTTQSLNGVSHEGLILNTAVPRPGLVRVDFDLYLINSWDGNSSIYGPDIFQFSMENGASVFRATFANVAGLTQTYPAALPDNGVAANNPAKTGASEINTLGYLPFTISGDAVYHFSLFAPVSDGILNFTVQDFSNGAGLADESWGMDNVQVTEVPEPSSVLLFLAAVCGIAGCRMRADARKSQAS